MPTHTLYIYRADSAHAFDFITQTDQVLYNCSWHMNSPYNQPRSHNIYCDLTSDNLDAARGALGQVAAQLGRGTEWELKPNRI